MYGLSSRGLADVLNPTAGTSLDCGLFAGGVFNKACWCASFPSLCSSADYVATKALEDPSVYNTLMQPPTVGAPTGAALTLPPASGADAAATENALLSQQILDWQAQDRASMAQTQSNLDALAKSQPPFCLLSTPVQAADGSWSCGGGSTNWLLYGATSGGTYPAALATPGGAFCLTPTFPWLGKTVAGAPGVCSGTPTIPDPWGNILTVVFPAALLFAMFKRGR